MFVVNTLQINNFSNGSRSSQSSNKTMVSGAVFAMAAGLVYCSRS